MKDINAFKKIEPNEELPMEVKERLMKNIKVVQLIGDVAELLSGKVGETAAKLFITENNNNEIK